MQIAVAAAAAAAADAKRSSCRVCCLDLSRVYGFNLSV
jgi:hypothetical protein